MTKRAKILIVDDEPFNVDYLEQELEDLDCDTVSASDGREALDQVEAEAPDAVLLDIMMPGMDGFEVLTRLKAEARTRDIPVIVISAMNDMTSVVRGIELGAEDYLPKPIDPVLLHARLSSSLERKRLRDQEQLYLQGLERELEIGRQIQGEFLPTTLPRLPGWDLAAYFQAAREVAGDFYDVFGLVDKRLLVFLVGDVSDKGVGAALYMTLFRTLLRTMASLDQYVEPLRCSDDLSIAWGEGADPLEHAVSLTNKYVASLHGQSSMFATLFFGLLDPASGLLRYINAGHEPPLLFDDWGVKQELVPTGPLVGLFPGASFAWAETRLDPGDVLLVCTDGITEAPDAGGALFGRERLLELLIPAPSTARALLDQVVAGVRQYAGARCQADDITMLAVRREES